MRINLNFVYSLAFWSQRSNQNQRHDNKVYGQSPKKGQTKMILSSLLFGVGFFSSSSKSRRYKQPTQPVCTPFKYEKLPLSTQILYFKQLASLLDQLEPDQLLDPFHLHPEDLWLCNGQLTLQLNKKSTECNCMYLSPLQKSRVTITAQNKLFYNQQQVLDYDNENYAYIYSFGMIFLYLYFYPNTATLHTLNTLHSDTNHLRLLKDRSDNIYYQLLVSMVSKWEQTRPTLSKINQILSNMNNKESLTTILDLSGNFFDPDSYGKTTI